MNSKTFYTYAELTHRSTTQLIAIYNRLFNTNIWDDMFNPFEARQEILLALFAEMRAQEIVAQMTDADRCAVKYQALKIVVSEEGMAVIWNTGEIKNNNCKRTEAQMRLIRELRADGETYKFIAQALNIPQIAVFHVLKGVYAVEETRWNADRKNKPAKARKSTFSAARKTVKYELKTVRANSEFWNSVGL